MKRQIISMTIGIAMCAALYFGHFQDVSELMNIALVFAWFMIVTFFLGGTVLIVSSKPEMERSIIPWQVLVSVDVIIIALLASSGAIITSVFLCFALLIAIAGRLENVKEHGYKENKNET